MNRYLRLVLQLLSLALFGLILWLGGAEAWRQILTGDRESILVSFLLIGSATILSAVRLRIVAGSVVDGALAPWRRFYYLNMTARALGLVAPRGLSAVGGKSLGLRAMGIPLKRAVWIVVLDNLFDLGLLSLLAVPALLFLRGEGSSIGFIVLALGLIMALGGVLWWAATAERFLTLIRWNRFAAFYTECLRHTPRLASALHLDPESAADLLPSRSAALQALGLSALLNTVIAASFYYISCAVGLTYPWLIFMAGFPITQLSLILAVTPGGLGLFDASWYGVLLLGGVPHQEALAFVVAQRAYIFVFVLIWAGFGALLSLTVER